MSALQRPIFEPESLPKGWRSPHDPPGSIFRPSQTREIYGVEPRESPVVAASFQSAPRLSPISPESNELRKMRPKSCGDEADAFDGTVLRLVTADYVAPKHDPVVVCLMARRAVEWLRDNPSEEIRPYLSDLEKAVSALGREMHTPTRFERALKTVFGATR